MKKKWIAYGVTGLMGIGVLATGAATAASAMELRTDDGQTVPSGAVVSTSGSVIDRESPVRLKVSDTSVTVASGTTAPTAASAPTATSAPTGASAPSATTAPSPATAPSAASAQSPASAPSAASPASPGSVASAASN